MLRKEKAQHQGFQHASPYELESIEGVVIIELSSLSCMSCLNQEAEEKTLFTTMNDKVKRY